MTKPSTLDQLQKWLEARKLYPYYVTADGTEPYDGYGVKRTGTGWVVYRCGPMSALKERHFDNEKDAVDDLLERLRLYGFAQSLSDFH
jgi:hypothetical protein